MGKMNSKTMNNSNIEQLWSYLDKDEDDMLNIIEIQRFIDLLFKIQSSYKSKNGFSNWLRGIDEDVKMIENLDKALRISQKDPQAAIDIVRSLCNTTGRKSISKKEFF